MLLEYDFLATLIWVRCYKKMHPPLTQRFHSHQRSQYSTLVQGFNIWSDYTYNFKQTSFLQKLIAFCVGNNIMVYFSVKILKS